MPEQIVSGGVTAIAAGSAQSLFLRSDGSLWGMGDNGSGELGTGNNFSTNRPEMLLLAGVTAIVGGFTDSAFLKSDGSLWSMGLNQYGELGIGSTVLATNLPQQVVAGAAGFNQIAIQLLNAGHVQLSFVGIAGNNYALDRAGHLSPPDWQPVAINTAGQFGLLVFTNTPNPATNNFWRVRSVP
jgi:alpha-tubulin suppressor-like RCC1 family protein